MSDKRQTLQITLIIFFLLAAVGLLWWSRRPAGRSRNADAVTTEKETKLPDYLIDDPRFKALRPQSGTIDIGQKGNPHPFEPFQ